MKRVRQSVPKQPTPPATPYEVRIPLKRATAENITALLTARDQASAVVTSIENRLHDTVRSLYTEHDIAEGKILELLDNPRVLVVVVTKAAPAEG